MGGNNVNAVNQDKIESLPSNFKDDHGLQTLLKLNSAARLHDLELLMKGEIETINSRQKRIRWLNSVMREINRITDGKKGSLDISDDSELRGLINAGKEMLKEAEAFEQEITDIANKLTELRSDPQKNGDAISELTKRKAFLTAEVSELRDTVKALSMAEEKKSFSQDERQGLIENIRLAHDDLTALNQQQMQSSSRLNNERHETILMAKMLAKILHEDIVNKARQIAR